MKFGFAIVISIIVYGFLCDLAVAQDNEVLLKNDPIESQNQFLLTPIENRRNGLSIAPNESTPNSTSDSNAMRSEFPTSSSKSVFWKSDGVTFENPVFYDPMLERYGIATSSQNIRIGSKFYLKGLLLPFSVFSKKRKSCVSPTGPFSKR